MGLRACDVMQAEVLAVPPDMTVGELQDHLLSERISGAPVVAGGRLVGIVSRSDIVRAFSLDRSMAGLIADAGEQVEYAPGETPEPPVPLTSRAQMEGRRVGEIMVTDPVTVAREAPIAEVARLFVRHHIHRLVVAEEGTVYGVISTLDLVRLVAEGKVGN